MRKQTPSQTVGPYFAYGLTPEQYRYDFTSLAGPEMIPGAATSDQGITIKGKVLDGKGDPIPDALIELWQDDGNRQLFGRCGTGTDPDNRFIFHTEKPVFDGENAPFITVVVFMRGQLIHSFTRLYFSDETTHNAIDPVLQSVPEDRRQTLIAQKNGRVYEWIIRMQGQNETVFFDY